MTDVDPFGGPVEDDPFGAHVGEDPDYDPFGPDHTAGEQPAAEPAPATATDTAPTAQPEHVTGVQEIAADDNSSFPEPPQVQSAGEDFGGWGRGGDDAGAERSAGWDDADRCEVLSRPLRTLHQPSQPAVVGDEPAAAAPPSTAAAAAQPAVEDGNPEESPQPETVCASSPVALADVGAPAVGGADDAQQAEHQPTVVAPPPQPAQVPEPAAAPATGGHQQSQPPMHDDDPFGGAMGDDDPFGAPGPNDDDPFSPSHHYQQEHQHHHNVPTSQQQQQQQQHEAPPKQLTAWAQPTPSKVTQHAARPDMNVSAEEVIDTAEASFHLGDSASASGPPPMPAPVEASSPQGPPPQLTSSSQQQQPQQRHRQPPPMAEDDPFGAAGGMDDDPFGGPVDDDPFAQVAQPSALPAFPTTTASWAGAHHGGGSNAPATAQQPHYPPQQQQQQAAHGYPSQHHHQLPQQQQQQQQQQQHAPSWPQQVQQHPQHQPQTQPMGSPSAHQQQQHFSAHSQHQQQHQRPAHGQSAPQQQAHVQHPHAPAHQHQQQHQQQQNLWGPASYTTPARQSSQERGDSPNPTPPPGAHQPTPPSHGLQHHHQHHHAGGQTPHQAPYTPQQPPSQPQQHSHHQQHQHWSQHQQQQAQKFLGNSGSAGSRPGSAHASPAPPQHATGAYTSPAAPGHHVHPQHQHQFGTQQHQHQQQWSPAVPPHHHHQYPPQQHQHHQLHHQYPQHSHHQQHHLQPPQQASPTAAAAYPSLHGYPETAASGAFDHQHYHHQHHQQHQHQQHQHQQHQHGSMAQHHSGGGSSGTLPRSQGSFGNLAPFGGIDPFASATTAAATAVQRRPFRYLRSPPIAIGAAGTMVVVSGTHVTCDTAARTIASAGTPDGQAYIAALQALPGPLTAATKPEDVIGVLERLSPGRSALKSLLVQIISKPKFEWAQDWPVVSRALAEDVERATLAVNPVPSHGPQMNLNAVATIQNLVVVGKRNDAVRTALESGLHAHALLIALMCDKETYCSTVSQTLRDITVPGTPLWQAYKLFNDLPLDPMPNDIQVNDGRLIGWASQVAMLASNYAPASFEGILTQGDALAQARRFDEAHFCYLLAQLAPEAQKPEYADGLRAKYNLLGGVHRRDRCRSLLLTPRNYFMTEALEYSRRRLQDKYVRPQLVPFKAMIAVQLMEIGEVTSARLYLDALAKLFPSAPAAGAGGKAAGGAHGGAAGQSRDPIARNLPQFVEQLRAHMDLMTRRPGQNAGGGGAGSTGLFGWLGGGGRRAASQPTAPSSSSASAPTHAAAAGGSQAAAGGRATAAPSEKQPTTTDATASAAASDPPRGRAASAQPAGSAENRSASKDAEEKFNASSRGRSFFGGLFGRGAKKEEKEKPKPMILDSDDVPEYDPVTGRYKFKQTDEEKDVEARIKAGPPKMPMKAQPQLSPMNGSGPLGGVPSPAPNSSQSGLPPQYPSPASGYPPLPAAAPFVPPGGSASPLPPATPNAPFVPGGGGVAAPPGLPSFVPPGGAASPPPLYGGPPQRAAPKYVDMFNS